LDVGGVAARNQGDGVFSYSEPMMTQQICRPRQFPQGFESNDF